MVGVYSEDVGKIFGDFLFFIFNTFAFEFLPRVKMGFICFLPSAFLSFSFFLLLFFF